MMHPDTELRYVNDQIGIGVFAKKFIPKGTIVWVLDDLDQILEEEYVESLDKVRQEVIYKYSYKNKEGQYILCWDHGRYINHSFKPNVIATAYELELAGRDIYPDEELTCDYGTLGDDGDFECSPEEGILRTRVTANDYMNFYEVWDEIAREAFTYFNHVKQPLGHLIREEFIEKVNAVAKGLRPLDSILSTFRNG